MWAICPIKSEAFAFLLNDVFAMRFVNDNMLLENKYYKIINRAGKDLAASFDLLILPDCEVYQGHFPSNPICPGACNIETIRECASLLAGKELHISYIKQCRFTSLATPCGTPCLQLEVLLVPVGADYNVTAKMLDERTIYVEFKGVFCP